MTEDEYDIEDNYEYTAHDLAVYPLCSNTAHPPALAKFLNDNYWTNGESEVRVGQVIADSCAVGYGGHFDEVLEDCTEGEVMCDLANHLAPKYKLHETSTYYLLYLIRDAYLARIKIATLACKELWKEEFYEV